MDRLVRALESSDRSPAAPAVVVAFLLNWRTRVNAEVVDLDSQFVLFASRKANTAAELSNYLEFLLVEDLAFQTLSFVLWI